MKMKKIRTTLTITAMMGLLLTGCQHQGDDASALQFKDWDDPEAMLAKQGFYGPRNDDFIPLYEQDLKNQFSDLAIPQPKDIPGAPGSGIPSLDQFRQASKDLAAIYQNVYFNTDDHIIRKPEYVQIINRIAQHLAAHPKLVLSIGGHCDERASEAYNLSLGTQRSNYVRGLLVKKGIDPNRIHTISYGKEQPADPGHHPTAWAKNRRVEFRIHEKE